MLNIKNILILFLIFLILFLGFFLIKITYFLIILTLFIGILAYGSFYIGSNFYMRTYCFTKKTNNEISITFDDGPNSIVTPKVLDILKEYDIKATFFCIGNKIAENESILKRIYNEGHIIGNHSYSHSIYFDFFSYKKILNELNETDNIIFKLINKKPKLFRPPYGVTNPLISKASKKNNYFNIGWNIRSLDTIKNEKEVLDRVFKKLKSGSIVLFHDNNNKIISILPGFIEYAINKNLKIISLDKLLKIDAYE